MSSFFVSPAFQKTTERSLYWRCAIFLYILLPWFKYNRTNVFLFALLFGDAPRGGQKNFIRSIFPINNHHDWCLRYASRKCILGSICPRQTFDKSWGRKPSFSWWNCGANRFLCYSELVHIRTRCKSANFKYDIGKLSTLPRNRNIYRVQVLYLKLRANDNEFLGLFSQDDA